MTRLKNTQIFESIFALFSALRSRGIPAENFHFDFNAVRVQTAVEVNIEGANTTLIELLTAFDPPLTPGELREMQVQFNAFCRMLQTGEVEEAIQAAWVHNWYGEYRAATLLGERVRSTRLLYLKRKTEEKCRRRVVVNVVAETQECYYGWLRDSPGMTGEWPKEIWTLACEDVCLCAPTAKA